MTRVDFYLIPDLDTQALYRFAARLACKAATSGKRVHLHTDSAAACTALDDLLWHYPAQRFVPHQVIDDTADTGQQALVAPISIGTNNPEHLDEVLINLAGDIPNFFGRFDRVAEIVLGDARAAGRARYKRYRDRGYPLHHHELDDWDA